MAREHRIVDAGGVDVKISSPDKVFFPERGETKADLIDYYLAVADPLLRAMQGRPTLVERFPDGAAGKSFFQKRVPKGAPEWLQTTTVSTPNGTTSEAMVVADIAHVVWAAHMGCLGFHPWPLRAAEPGVTDELRIDLDPGPGAVDLVRLRDAAREVRAYFDEHGIVSFPKTTGNRGIHVYVRVAGSWDSYDVRAAAVTVARALQDRRPDLVTAAWWKEERHAPVFVDFNQNAPHKTVFGAWCVRPRVGAQVSTPFDWDELDDIEPDRLTMPLVVERVRTQGDPWATIDDAPQDITALVDAFHAHIAAGGTDEPWPPVYPKMPHEPPRVAPSRARS